MLQRLRVEPPTTTPNLIEPSTIIGTITSVLGQVINGLVLALLILVGVIFTIGESDRFGDKLRSGLEPVMHFGA